MKNKKLQLPILILIVGFAYGGYLFFDFVSEEVPKLEQKLAVKEGALTAKNAELRRLRSFSENIESVKVSLRELNVQLEAALESMPRNYDLAGLLRKLSVIGFNSGVELSAFRPGAGSTKEGDFYETSVAAFNLSGSFTQIMSFFDQALRLKRIIRIERVSVRNTASADTGTAQARGAGTAAGAEVSAKLYRFVE